jgi:hypothetical protein
MSEPSALQGLLQDLAGQERHSPRSDVVRLVVRLRARDACEYCLLPTVGQFHVAHVVPPSAWKGDGHGSDHVDNYAWCCPFCNAARAGRTEGKVDGAAHRLYDPRRDHWRDHFAFGPERLTVLGTSPIGRATEATLAFNDPRPGRSLWQRQRVVADGQYPPSWAKSWPAVDEGA